MTNEETGEQTPVILEENRGRGAKPNGKGSDFVMMWWKSVHELDLTGSEAMLLAYLHSQSNSQGVFRYRLDDIATHMNLTGHKYAWRLVDSLIRKGAAIRTRRGEVRLNPYPMWQGHLSDRQAAIVKWHSALANAKLVEQG